MDWMKVIGRIIVVLFLVVTGLFIVKLYKELCKRAEQEAHND